MTKQVWTQDMRRSMYARLHLEFGPHRSWAGSRSPIDRGRRFAEVLSELATYFSDMLDRHITPDAVKNQIDWGITVQKGIKARGHARNFILNKAAALEVGFIASTDLPALIRVGHK